MSLDTLNRKEGTLSSRKLPPRLGTKIGVWWKNDKNKKINGYVPYVAEVTSSTSNSRRRPRDEEVTPESFRATYHGETIERNHPLNGGMLYYKIRPMKPSELREGQILALEPHLDETGEDGFDTGERPCTLVRLLQITKQRSVSSGKNEIQYTWCYLEDECENSINTNADSDNNASSDQHIEHNWTQEDVVEEPADLWHIVPDESLREVENHCSKADKVAVSKKRKVISD
mmetsp:Transcript_14053/g.20768  ORF Transcript_14053/g.20768 Transcript_14053/m.20768 type:complete len:230 (-) Transcript_14053:2386-3075(-)